MKGEENGMNSGSFIIMGEWGFIYFFTDLTFLYIYTLSSQLQKPRTFLPPLPFYLKSSANHRFYHTRMKSIPL